jgi:hypothetical protein
VPQDDFLGELEQFEEDLSSVKSRIRFKKKKLSELMRHQLCYKRVLKRNEKFNDKHKVQMPFIIAQVPRFQSNLQVR